MIMKKITFSLVSLFICLAFNAQTVLTYDNHALMPGDQHDFVLANPAEVVEGSAGANMIWDYSSLVKNGQNLTSYMLSPLETEKGKKIKSNTVLQEYNNQFYFKINNNIIEQYGTVSCNTVTKYHKPFVKMKYPFGYGDQFSGTFSGIQEFEDNQAEVNGTYNVEADGFGTLILPGAEIHNVLRVKTERTTINSNSENKVITYRWYSYNVRYPLLVIIKHVTPSKSYISTVAFYQNANKVKSAPLADNNLTTMEEDATFTVYPNPYKDEVNVKYNLLVKSKVSIEIYDALGRKIKDLMEPQMQEQGDYNFKFSTTENDFSSGTYYLKINTNENSKIKKIIELD